MRDQLVLRSQLSQPERVRLDYLARRGRRRRILPGVYSIDDHETWLHRVHACQLRFPRAVLCGPTAAKLQFWDDLDVNEVHLTGARVDKPPDWLKHSRAVVPPQLRTERELLAMTTPELTVLDLIPTMGGKAIDEGLRRKAVTLSGLHEALRLTPGRSGNQSRLRLLEESRENPWSELERQGHALLRKHRFRHWRGNYRIQVGWEVFYADVAIPDLKLLIEFDGWRYHRSKEDLARDIRRQNTLVLAGWTVLRYCVATLEDMPDQIRRYQRRLGAPGPSDDRNPPPDASIPPEVGDWDDLGEWS
ncbi:DUF559 domain-containing protein [Aestuariimicrobium sp. Y1814]|uniref:DUF559 domain-containing protein n=1 Tax=Aestuariimicrobium sp. Y1814 TaxID=3418742 RepID=UPI003DA75E6E